MRGFSEVYGSWNTIWMFRRTALRPAPDSLEMSSPLNRTWPEVARSRFISTLASVDLPQPDSPTIPSVSPFASSKETPSTALTAPTCFLNRMPWVSG